MKQFLFVFFLYFLLKLDTSECFNYCEIQFPKPDITFSTKFDILTDNGKLKFTKLNSYIPGRTYDITVSLTEKSRNEHLTIKEIYVFVNDVQIHNEESEEDKWKNGGKILFNVSHASKTEYCPQRAYFQYLYTQPQQTTFYWTAPKKSMVCIRITIILTMYDENSEALTEEKSHVICERNKMMSDQMQMDLPGSPSCEYKKIPDTKKCPIGSTAIYRMTIENNWDSMTHWKDWPAKDGYTPRLTQYLGASHSDDFNLYNLGGMADDGVLGVCGNGTYDLLQKRFYSSGKGILTVILARSIDTTSKTKRRSALIVVNATHHLVSFLSRLEPSPDWCTGLSRFDLCGGRCQWTDQITIPLYPWDAGIYNGETYTYKKEKQNQSPICPITATWPKDNPFSSMDGKIINIGTVTFKLIQEYNKQDNRFCSSVNVAVQDEAYSNENIPKQPQLGYLTSNSDRTRHCVVSPWEEWSSCSKTCGKGERVRYRTLIKGKAEKCSDIAKKEVENCYQKCPILSSLETCSFRLWGSWSPCNATCFQTGMVYRERVFINDQEKHDCMKYPEMKSVHTCSLSATRCNSQDVCKEYLNIGDSCSWSPSSLRYYYDFSTGKCNSFVYKGCHGGLNNFHTSEECYRLCSSQFSEISSERSKAPMVSSNRCNVLMTWGMACDSENPSTRWFYDKIIRKCFKFHFAGCRGNANNFKTKEECEKVCLSMESQSTNWPTQPVAAKSSCQYSQWSEWTSCEDDCRTLQTRFRSVIEKEGECNEELNDSRNCQLEKCSMQKTITKCKYSNWSEWSSCSSRCGQGVRERKRKKLSYNCKPEFPQFNQRESCYNACAFY